ncbi:DMT family transporter [Thaumasiovibrio subtropicus]|uniref:DMT family transporter n=1 Tax=Thaumasiovibrio subtropicus TaxID=1891207 RepID=UPI000B35410D|nr:DMT family transporter [Thaumasiovibrio subtropicus]
MKLNHALLLLLLAFIWGASFLFMRVSVPSLGPAVLILGRVGSAALTLWIVAMLLKRKMPPVARWRHFLVIGLFNAALPFMLYAFAAQTVTASLLSILNATAPLWGTVITAVWFKQKVSAKVLVGLFVGLLGVAILVGFDPVMVDKHAYIAAAAAVCAAMSYGIGATYAQTAPKLSPEQNAHGCLWAASLWVLPLTWFMPINTPPSGLVVLNVLLLGIVCTAVAYLILFHLITEIGASSTLTVTFLIPVFGVLWGNVFLDEPIGFHTVIGAIVTLIGTALVTGFRLPLSKKQA